MYLLPLCRFLQPEQGDIVDQSRVVEARVDNDAGNVELFVSQRLCGRADVILSQSNFQDLTDIVDERKAMEKHQETRSSSEIDCFF